MIQPIGSPLLSIGLFNSEKFLFLFQITLFKHNDLFNITLKSKINVIP